MERESIKELEEYRLTMTSLKMWHAEYPETQSVGIIELSEKEQWLGPIGKRVNVGFLCLACGKTFKTHGNGNRSWKQEQLPGAHAAWTHSKGARHVKQHNLWLQKKVSL